MGGHSASRGASRPGLRKRHLQGLGVLGATVPGKQLHGDWWPSFWFVYSAHPQCTLPVSGIVVCFSLIVEVIPVVEV